MKSLVASSLVFGLAADLVAQQADHPRVVVRVATSAVEGDSAARVAARFTSRVSRDQTDRAALLGVATIARLRYDYHAADSAYRRLIAGGRDAYTVYAHLGLGHGYEARSLGLARREFDSARSVARDVNDRAGESEALIWLAFTRGRLEGVAVAEALLDTASRLVPDTALDLQSRLRARRAIAHVMRGRPMEASAAAESSIVIARRGRDARAEADGYRVAGQILQVRGQLDSSLAALSQSEALFDRARSKSALANLRIWQAQTLSGLARYGEFRDVMRRGLAEGEATNNPGAVAQSHRALGVLAQMLGDWPGAADHLRRSAEISSSIGDSSGVISTNQYIAKVAFVAGDVATARRLTNAWLEWARRTENAGAQFDAYRSLAHIALAEGNVEAATRALEGARAQLRVLPGEHRRAWLAHDDARFALARGDLTSAERLLREYVGEGEPRDGAYVTRFDARVRLADIYARRGDLARAERELQTATDHIDSWRAQLNDAQVRALAYQAATSTEAASTETAEDAARSARVFAALASGGRGASAFALVERWRARELANKLARAALLAAPSRAGTTARAAPRSAAEVASAIPDERTAVVEYVAAEGAPITIFVVQRRGVEARALPSFDSLAATVGRFSALVESGSDATTLGRSLGKALMDSVLPILDRRVTRLVIVPDGPLHRLPFDALRLTDGRYLVQRFALGFSPSASVAAALWTSRSASSSAVTRLLALGNPSTPVATEAAKQGSDGEEFFAAVRAAGGLPPLPGASREARLVARYAADSDVRLGSKASAAFLKQTDLRSYRVLHFAAHGIIDEQSVAGTALALAPGNGESGFVGAADLAALKLSADLVVLSACQSAGGVLVRGEGVQGLTSPLLQAGARSIIATDWRILDEDAVTFVESVYDAMARGLPVVDALRDAKLRALQRGGSSRTWAAFRVIGDPLVVVPLRTPARSWWARIARSR